jgi:phage tail sheath protein FI
MVGGDPADYTVQLSLGADDFTNVDDAELIAGFELFTNTTEADIALIFMGPAPNTVTKYVIDNVVEQRRDSVVTISPPLESVRGSGIAQKVVDAKDLPSTGINRSTSYGIFDGNWKLMFDPYNETNVWVPCNPDVAGLCAETDENRDPWWSPAGFERGRLKNVQRLAWNPSKPERDILYRSGVNPIVTFPTSGPILFGDKTMLSRPSAFDRINVRRLFITLQRKISDVAKYNLFEFNDPFTRAQFRNIIEPFLRDVQGRRGIYDYRVVCDESNNTEEVINRNEFVGSIFIKPAKSINFVILNFVAVRSDVEFTEVFNAV